MKSISTFLVAATLFALSIPSMAQWTDVSTGASHVEIFGIKMWDDANGYAVGRNHNTSMGYIFKTTTGGTTWTADSFSGVFFRAVDMATANNGSAVGYNSIPATSTLVYNTTNGGSSWSPITVSGTYLGMENIQFISSTNGFATGYGATFGTTAGCWTTSNGGTSWTQAGSLTTLGNGMEFLNGSTGFIATGASSSSGTLQKTTNGGTNWLFTYSGPWTHDVSIVDADTVYCISGLSSANLQRSTNGGNTFTQTGSIGAVRRFEFVDHQYAYACGGSGAIFATSDRGYTWTAETSGTSETFNEIDISANYAWVAGTAGAVFRKSLWQTSVGENSNIQKVDVWPNPTTNDARINIKVKSPVNGTVTVRNIAGQIVSTSQEYIIPGGHQLNLGLDVQPSGVYFVSLDADNSNQVFKVVKQ